MHRDKISVIGLGKVGSPMVACFASKGYQVVGVDVNTRFVDLVNQGTSGVNEPGLNQMLDTHKEMIRATVDFADAIQETAISFIIVPTPTDESTGGFSNDFILAACSRIGESLQKRRIP